MKRVFFLVLFSLFSVLSFASFPVETQELFSDPKKFKLDFLAFFLGIVTLILLPYSLLLLFIKKKNFRGSLALGWLAGFILALLVIAFQFGLISVPDVMLY